MLGLVILVGGQGVLIWAEQYIASGYTAILAATLPVWFVMLDKKQWHNSFSNRNIIAGLLVGFIGILLLFGEHLDAPVAAAHGQMGVIATLAVLFSCICWVSGSLYYRYKPTPGSIISNLGWQLIGGAVFCFAISSVSGELNLFYVWKVGWKAWGLSFIWQ